MQNKKADHACAYNAVAEIFHVEVNNSEIEEFVSKGETIHKFFSQLEGYSGMEMLFLDDTNITILVRWMNYRLFDKNLSHILTGCPVTEWFKKAIGVSHRPAILKSFSFNKHLK